MKTAIAILVAAIAVFFWGFAYWGATKIPYQAWTPAADDAAAQQALREHFPANGVYGVPSAQHDLEAFESLTQAGPTALVFITAAEGRPAMVPSVMIFGFLHEVVVAALLAALLGWVGAGLGFGGKVRLALLVGVISVAMTQFGDAIWWMLPWGWKLVTSFYEIVCFLIMGLVLGKMLPARP
ncbi:MAG: DUF1761 family protein [Acidobacteria bacterium]|nr:DUF1761 family protein [Acidobacteriota bacterium]